MTDRMGASLRGLFMPTHAIVTGSYRANLQRLAQAMLAAHRSQQALMRTLNGTEGARRIKAQITAQSLQRWLDAVARRYPDTALHHKSLTLLAAYRSEVGSFRWDTSGNLIRCGSAAYYPPVPTDPDEINDFLWNGVFRLGESIYSELDQLRAKVGELSDLCITLESRAMQPQLTAIQKRLFAALEDNGVSPMDESAVMGLWQRIMVKDFAEYSRLDILGVIRGTITLYRSGDNADSLVSLFFFLKELGHETPLEQLYNEANPDQPIKRKNGNGAMMPVKPVR